MVTYVWRWGPCGGKHPETGRRKGESVELLARGRCNSALVRFEDGLLAVVSRNGIRRNDAAPAVREGTAEARSGARSGRALFSGSAASRP